MTPRGRAGSRHRRSRPAIVTLASSAALSLAVLLAQSGAALATSSSTGTITVRLLNKNTGNFLCTRKAKKPYASTGTCVVIRHAVVSLRRPPGSYFVVVDTALGAGPCYSTKGAISTYSSKCTTFHVAVGRTISVRWKVPDFS